MAIEHNSTDLFRFCSDLIVPFLKGGGAETPSKREKVMLNFPFGSRQENTMGVLCPGGMQGIPEDGHRPPELSVFYNRRLESSERVHYVHLVQAG